MKLSAFVLLTSFVSVFVADKALCEEAEQMHSFSSGVEKSSQLLSKTKRQGATKKIGQLSEVERPSTSAQMLLVQSPASPNPPSVPPWEGGRQGGEVVLVTGVKANPTSKGVEVILQTSKGEQLQLVNRSTGNSFITDIPNAQLRLPSGDGFTFRSDKPIAGVTEITVTNFDAKTVRVTVTGEAGVPTVELFDSPNEGLIFSVASTAPSVQQGQPQTQQPQAQQPESQTQPSQPSASGDEPIELVVTGQQDGYSIPDASITKTDTPILNTPRSIQVIPQQVLEDQKVVELQDALRNVSGVVISGGPRDAFQNFTIRGFSSGGIYRNGLRIGSDVFETSNLERVEVLKGPASVLFGRGNVGGIVNLVTKKPLATPLYAFEASIGNYNFYSGSVDFSGPLDAKKTVLYRLNASILDSKSFVDFIENDRYFVAPSFTWLIGDNTSLTFTGEYQYSRYPNERGLPKIGTITDNPNGSIPRSRFLGEPSFDQRNSETFRVGYDLEHRFSQNWSVRNAFLTVVEQTQQYSTAAVRLLSDNQTLERTSFFDVGEVERGSIALDTKVTGKFSTGSVQHKLLFGVDLSRTFGGNNYIERKIGSINIFNPVYNQISGDVVSRFDSNTFTNALGLYVQDEISLLDSLILVLGGRFDIVDQRVENYLKRANDTTQQDDAFSPQVGIVYKPIEPISIYASFARSFQPITGTTLEGNLFQPERGTQYEIGIKADINEKLSATLAFYDLTRSNVTTPDPRNTRFSIQTGEQNSQGIELDITGEILPGWNVIASYAYTDAKVTKDTRTTLVNNRLNNVPEHSFSLWTTYELLKGNLKGLGFSLGFFYIGERQGDLNNTFTLPSYLRTDAAIFYKKNDLRVALNLKNLFGIDYFESADSDLRVFPGSPFTVQGTISWEF